MLPSIIDSMTIPILEQVVNFAQARHTVLAGNIANLDTPGYRVKDLSVEKFQDRLKDAIATRKARNVPVSGSFADSGPGDPIREVRDSLKDILFHDESDVSIEQQFNEVNKNQAMHNLAIAIMTSQFRMLQTAISERV